MDTVYAIGDIHGHLSKLEQALALVEAEAGPDAEVVFLGDLVDRGPASRGVLDLLIAGQAAGRRWTVLKGNHDLLFQTYLESGTEYDPRIRSGKSWLHDNLGGYETLRSYGVLSKRSSRDLLTEARATVPEAHLHFLTGLPLYHERGDLLFVHAGIVPGAALKWQGPDELLWIREPFLSYARPHPWLVVHGHSAVDYPEHRGNRVNLDGGAGHGRALLPAVFEGRKVSLLTDAGRVPLG